MQRGGGRAGAMRGGRILRWAAMLLVGSSAVLTTWGCGSDGRTGPDPVDDPPPPEPTPPPRPPPLEGVSDVRPTLREADLQILYVQRLPILEYVVDSPDPASDGWPLEGSEVTWVGHVRNAAPEDRQAVGYRWLLDENVLSEGQVDIPAGGVVQVEQPWTWTFDRHVLSLELDPADDFVEEARNNRLDLFTDALSVGFYVEESFHAYFAEHQHELAIGSNSFEDWAHRQIAMFNELFEKARYPESPDGVLDRVRLDRVHVVPDGALPLDPGPPIGGFDSTQARPDANDRTVDLQWGFPARMLELGIYDDHTSLDFNNQFFYSGFVQHELGHARYLTDTYAWDVEVGPLADRMEIEEDGVPIAGRVWLPGTRVNPGTEDERILVHRAEQGLMHSHWTFMDRYAAVSWNLIAGHRATRGNFNAPANLGAFLNDLPARNTLTLVDRLREERLANADVQVYRSDVSDADPHFAYRMSFDDTPDMSLRTDERGRVQLGRNPFAGSEPIVVEHASNGVVLIRVEQDGRVGYGFLESTAFNLAYWRGETDRAEHVLYLRMVE